MSNTSFKLFLSTVFIITLFTQCQKEQKQEADNPPVQEQKAVPDYKASWIPFETNEVKAGLRGLCAITDSIVWASGSGGTVLRTVDGGQTWELKEIPGAEELGFRDIYAFDKNNALVISAGTPARIYKTADGGDTWTNTFASDNEQIFFDAFDFWDKQNGIAFSDPVDGHFYILVTEDGGNSWQEIPKKDIPPVIEGEAGFAASGTCLTLYGDRYAWIGTGGAVARVFASSDKGRTWKAYETPIQSGSASKGIFSVAFRDEMNGVVVGGDYQSDTVNVQNAAFTTDGGQTWTLVEENPPNGYRSCVTFFGGKDKEQVIAVGTSGTDYSPDGGRNWYFLDSTPLNVVSFSNDEKYGFAAGPGGIIARLEY